MSPIIHVDLSQINQPMDPGTYPATIVSADGGVSKAGGPKVVVKLEVVANGKTHTRQVHQSITGEGAFGFDRMLRACKLNDAADQFKKAPGDFNTDVLIGQKLLVCVEADTYNGAPSDKINGFLPV